MDEPFCMEGFCYLELPYSDACSICNKLIAAATIFFLFLFS
jgi:hypothetical protein